MPYHVSVSVQGEDTILQYVMDERSGALEPLQVSEAGARPSP